MNNHYRVSTKIILSLFALLLVFATSIDATPMNARRIHLRQGTSANWAGYAVETNLSNPKANVVTDVYGSWVVPTIDCSATPNAYSSMWVGIDGYSTNTVEQIGTDADCYSGTPVYYAWYEMYPQYPTNLQLQISPGDLMQGEVKFIGSGRFTLTIRDVTKGKVFTTTQTSMSAKRASAEWIVEAPSSSGQVLPLAKFSMASFKDARAAINGVTGTISNARWQRDPLNMTSQYDGSVKAATSALTTDGKSFNVTWAQSN